MDLIKVVNEAFATKKEFPAFKSGDTITVAYRIKEGNKERIQQYRGVVIRISGHGDKKRFTVRKMSENVGVERIFLWFYCHTKKPSDSFRTAFLFIDVPAAADHLPS